jgi:hypothetical protein
MRKLYLYIFKVKQFMADRLSQLLEHATSQGYKSNIIKPLLGMEIILLFATVALFRFNALLFAYILGSLAIVVVIGFLFSYFYCLFNNPDLLRSERYNLEKTAIEKVAVTGDSVSSPEILLPQRDFVLIRAKNDKSE